MNTARSDTTAVSSSDGEYIIVIGGYGGFGVGWTVTVELLQLNYFKSAVEDGIN